MFNFAGKLVASKKIFMLYVISLFILWFGVRISSSYITRLCEQIYISHQIWLVKPSDSLLFTESVGTYLLGIQFAILIFLMLIMKESIPDTSREKNVLTETILITLVSLNAIVVTLFILGLNFIFNPTKVVSVFILLFIIIAASFIAYNIKNETDESDLFSKRKIWLSILNRCKNFSFPHFRIAIIFYFALMYGYVTLVREASTEQMVVQPIIKLIFGVTSTACILYSLIGIVKNIGRKDELQRQMYYEQTFIVYIVLIGLMLSYYAFTILFNFTLNSQDVMIVLIMTLLVSGFFVRARYQ